MESIVRSIFELGNQVAANVDNPSDADLGLSHLGDDYVSPNLQASRLLTKFRPLLAQHGVPSQITESAVEHALVGIALFPSPCSSGIAQHVLEVGSRGRRKNVPSITG
jgi:hypothetical protein